MSWNKSIIEKNLNKNYMYIYSWITTLYTWNIAEERHPRELLCPLCHVWTQKTDDCLRSSPLWTHNLLVSWPGLPRFQKKYISVVYKPLDLWYSVITGVIQPAIRQPLKISPLSSWGFPFDYCRESHAKNPNRIIQCSDSLVSVL